MPDTLCALSIGAPGPIVNEVLPRPLPGPRSAPLGGCVVCTPPCRSGVDCPGCNTYGRPARLRAAAHLTTDLGAALALDLDGVVIATPSSLHAAQCAAALDRAVPVFTPRPEEHAEFCACAVRRYT